MATVQTVRGPIDSSQLGRVLVHEHIFTMHTEYTQNYRPDFCEHESIATAVARLNELKAAGIDTIIDLTVLGLGRYVPRIEMVAAQTELNIIVATGVYTFDELPMPLRGFGAAMGLDDDTDPMPDLFVGDLTRGIAHTKGVRAGELKCAIDAPGLTPGVERVLRACGKANLRTGVPITVHTSAQHETGLVAQRVLADEGVDLRDVIIGHCGDSTDLDYLRRLADRGSILGMDRFGMDGLLPFEARVATIVKMIELGYLDSLTVSHDCFCWTDAMSLEAVAALKLSYVHISHQVLPALRKAGVTERQIDAMLIDNPRRHFEGAAERFAARTPERARVSSL
jgi:phosphotriesterase-related protein